MARVVQFPVSPPEKLGPKRARRKTRPNLEDFGQLNLFDAHKEARLISMSPAGSFFEQALALDEEGHPDAEKYYLLAIKNEENKEDALCNLGILKSTQGDMPAAIDYLTQCLQINPRHFEAHYNLANAYSEIGNFPLARTHYEVSIQIEPEFPNSHYNLGLVLISLKEYRQAITVIDRYVRLAPGGDHSIANELIKTLQSFA